MPKTGGVMPSGEGPWGELWLQFYLIFHLYPLAAMAVLAYCLTRTAPPTATARVEETLPA